jgi:hypothetical protein
MAIWRNNQHQRRHGSIARKRKANSGETAGVKTSSVASIMAMAGGHGGSVIGASMRGISNNGSIEMAATAAKMKMMAAKTMSARRSGSAK